jgi:hypothetical protein
MVKRLTLAAVALLATACTVSGAPVPVAGPSRAGDPSSASVPGPIVPGELIAIPLYANGDQQLDTDTDDNYFVPEIKIVGGRVA